MKLFKNLYLDGRLFQAVSALVVLFVLGYFYPVVFVVAKALFFVFVVAVAVDAALLFRPREGIFARRAMADKLSNGDENEIRIFLENHYGFKTALTVIDELPFQFQMRDSFYKVALESEAKHVVTYSVRPVRRGEYSFGAVNVYAASPIGLLLKRYRFDNNALVPVYPSYLQLRKYELLAISNRLMDAGIKKVRKIGRTMEFDQVRDYVQGDDYRTVNWLATARRQKLMVNQYQDEKSQQVYCIIDKGRTMKMPFDGMSLLDYAINTSLVMSNVAILKDDRAGLVTFSHKPGILLPAEKRRSQMQKILEILYNQKTRYLESNFEMLYATVRRQITQYSLLLLFTNFESLSALERQLQFLKSLAKHHLLVVIFFENTELHELALKPASTTEEVYNKTIAEQFIFEKKVIVKELERHGIQAILTAPENLTVNTINKYLELKARRMI